MLLLKCTLGWIWKHSLWSLEAAAASITTNFLAFWHRNFFVKISTFPILRLIFCRNFRLTDFKTLRVSLLSFYIFLNTFQLCSYTFFKWANPGLFFVYFWSFQTNITNFNNKYLWKNVHPVYSVGIRTHVLRNESPPITTRPGQLKGLTGWHDNVPTQQKAWLFYKIKINRVLYKTAYLFAKWGSFPAIQLLVLLTKDLRE